MTAEQRAVRVLVMAVLLLVITLLITAFIGMVHLDMWLWENLRG
jgi:hypothetical protein